MASSGRWFRIGFGAFGIAALACVALFFLTRSDIVEDDVVVSSKVAATVGPVSPQVARGRYIATAADCVACHTAPGGAAFAGGLALKTPFGTLLSSNITSDRDTGIGGWNEHKFEAAVRKGIGRNGHLYPAMPYTAYTRMSDADVADLWAYMQTVAPVSHAISENHLPFPFRLRPLLTFWNVLLFKEGRFQADPKASAQVNRGAYLAEALEHCGMCHTPKNILGGDLKARSLEGAALQNWHAPDLTNNAHTGLAEWNEHDIVEYLKSGTNRLTGASGPMEEAIVNSTQHLSDADLTALAAYLKALPSRDVPAGPAIDAASKTMIDGQQIYRANCTACHASTGTGVKAMVPLLGENPAIVAKDPTSLLHVLLKGTHGTATETNPTGAGMPRFDWKLDDGQIASVLTYIRNSWGNAAPAVTPKQVSHMRKATGAGAPLAVGN